MNVTFSSDRTPVKIHDNDNHVGNIIKTNYGFLVEFNGVYYAPDNRIRINSGGTTGRAFKKLYEAKRYASEILWYIKVKPYAKETESYAISK